jgi:hypothetical protein
MIHITIKTIPDNTQRYNTVGDYYEDAAGKEVITVSDLGDWRSEVLVAIHELVESSLCKNRGITNKQIDAFDIQYNKDRKGDDGSEPGDDPRAPYYKEHAFAMKIEKIMAEELKVDWNKHNDVIAKLNTK